MGRKTVLVASCFRPKADAAVGAITSSGRNHLDKLEINVDELEVAILFLLSETVNVNFPKNHMRW
jgi:hypothetical protein